jgi:hypothetical protein
MLASAEEAGRISAILKEDISQMGAKSWGLSSASGQVFEVADEVYINYSNNTDLSSFTLDKTGNFDELTFKKVHYDANGICGAVMTIKWSVTADGVLMRECIPSNTPAKCNGSFTAATDCPSSMEMARNVSEFKFLPSKPGISGSSSSGSLLFDGSSGFELRNDGSQNTGGSTSSNGNRVSIKDFGINSPPPAAPSNVGNFCLAENNVFACKTFNFKAGEKYAFEFELPYVKLADGTGKTESYNKMAMFQAGRDHLAVGLRNSNGSLIENVPDFLFFPPQNDLANQITRYFEFSVPSDVSAIIRITSAFYSDAVEGGHLEIDNFKVYKKTDEVYHFPSSASTLTPAEKATVKAFKLTLGIDKRGEIKKDTIVIPVPNNGVVPTGGV